MKKTTFGVGFLLIAIPVFAQQSTTNTDCNVNGQQVNCTSMDDNPGSPEWRGRRRRQQSFGC